MVTPKKPVKKKKKTQKNKYEEVIDIVLKICKTKGWEAWSNTSDKDFQFAEINLFKKYNMNEITGVLNITIVDGIKYSIVKTSFHSYGLNDLLDAISLKFDELDWVAKEPKEPKDKKGGSVDISNILTTILKNFDKTARQIKKRHDDRQPFIIQDEYDTQDLLHAILRAYFSDVRQEEYAPSYAGSNSRVDFLLKKEKIVIEIKFASLKLKEKEAGEQLIIDIKRYQTHPDCENCIV